MNIKAICIEMAAIRMKELRAQIKVLGKEYISLKKAYCGALDHAHKQ